MTWYTMNSPIYIRSSRPVYARQVSKWMRNATGRLRKHAYEQGVNLDEITLQQKRLLFDSRDPATMDTLDRVVAENMPRIAPAKEAYPELYCDLDSLERSYHAWSSASEHEKRRNVVLTARV